MDMYYDMMIIQAFYYLDMEAGKVNLINLMYESNNIICKHPKQQILTELQ